MIVFVLYVLSESQKLLIEYSIIFLSYFFVNILKFPHFIFIIS
jgi:hypothetical protein